MDSTLEQLAQYVSQQLRQGMTEQSIRASLAQNRWTPEWIDAVFNVVHQNPNLYKDQTPVPSTQPVAAQPQASLPNFNRAQVTAQPVPESQITELPSSASIRQGKSKRVWAAIAAMAVLLGLAVGAYFLFQPKDQPTNSGATNNKQAEQKQSKSSDEQRKDDLNTLLSDLADLYVTNGFYPTNDKLKESDFAAQNPGFDTSAFADPKWTADNKACTAGGKAIMSVVPAPNCYAYSATTPDGKPCDNISVKCTHMTITATLDGGKPYAITLERNIELEN